MFLTTVLLSCLSDNSDWRGNIYKFTQEIDDSLKSSNSDFIVENCATDYSFVPDYYRLNKSKKVGELDNLLNLSDSNFRKVGAADYIIEESANYEVVMLNEAHHYPKHRAFATDLLIGLKNNGYKYIGVETLTDFPFFESPEFPTQNLGYYSVEPTFGNFIREAINLGFVLFPYEASSGKNGKEREIQQAQNIAEFMEDNKDGKVFIYCGYDHNYEEELPMWGKAMAGRLTEYTGLDPLTINQTVLNDIEELGSESYVWLDTFGMAHQHIKGNDIFVVHTKDCSKFKRLEWKKRKNNSWLKVDFITKVSAYPILVKVFYNTNEKENNGIPYDIVEMTTESMENWLIVPDSKYLIVLQNKKGDETIIEIDN